MQKISLTRGMIAVVDDEDFRDLAAYKWCAAEKGGKKFYAVRRPAGQQGGALISMHRQITKASPEMDVDHINGDTLDNRRVNLRAVAHRVNIRHRPFGANRNNAVGIRGVTWDKTRGKYAAGLKVAGKRLNLGRFDTAEAADTICQAARLKYYGAAA